MAALAIGVSASACGTGAASQDTTTASTSVRLARGAHPQLPVFMLAHSMGGTFGVQYALAHQRRPVTVHAAVAIGSQRANTAAQEEALKLLDVNVGRVHARYFRQDQAGSCTLH